jgi:hypothetical protein
MASQIQPDDWHQRMQVNLPKPLGELPATYLHLLMQVLKAESAINYFLLRNLLKA